MGEGRGARLSDPRTFGLQDLHRTQVCESHLPHHREGAKGLLAFSPSGLLAALAVSLLPFMPVLALPCPCCPC